MPRDPTHNAAELQAKAHQKLTLGSLPVAPRRGRVYVGYGGDHVCDLCDEQISSHQQEIEVPELSARPLWFHFDCDRAWRDVSMQLGKLKIVDFTDTTQRR